jgi:pimeloyl-ACP methyl ester carboxylesterase
VLALHDPAGSHALVLPFVAGMAQSRPVVALDLPGNGESDYVMGSSEPSLDDYATAVLAASDALGLEELDVVGRYSGAPIGMQMSLRRPAQVKHLALVGIELYSSQRVEELLRHYTPTVSPSSDGAHLALAWHMMSNQSLYWPWYRQLHDHVVSGEPQRDAGVIHQRVFDLLRVGDRYRHAYRALWTYPMEQRLPLLSVPALLCAPRWDPLFEGLEACHRAAPRLTQLTLPDRFESWPAPLMHFFDTALAS